MKYTNSIPEWMLESENYIPPKDSDGFITKTILSIGGVLSKAKYNGNVASSGSVPIKLITIFVLILLMALSRNMFFTYFVLAAVLLRICLLREKVLKKVIGTAFAAFCFSMIILLPAVFLGSPKTMLTVSIKVFLSVSLVQILSVTNPWNQITGALRAFHIPALFILTFDITLKYIVLLGDICLNMLEALKLRSVGKNRDKKRSFSGILGVTFLKSQEMSEEMYQAMICRGFDGEYQIYQKQRFQAIDLLYLLLLVVYIGLFCYLEGII
ncbi:MAG: energy-coupling factor transporter transmembrane protein EcfT [Lachnospiraceae bacterium]|nr:energy-coupling factor transporter transmembrane protein EcfT [Lachnospiraceae bacterium]